jgi:hypothetical protein
VRGAVDVETFARSPEPKVIALAQRMRWVGEPNTGFPARFPAALEARLRDGRRLEARVPDVLGSPERPAAAGALQAKFAANARRSLPDEQGGAIERWVRGLEHANDCAALTSALASRRDCRR